MKNNLAHNEGAKPRRRKKSSQLYKGLQERPRTRWPRWFTATELGATTTRLDVAFTAHGKGEPEMAALRDEADWYFQKDGKVYGPYPEAELKQLVIKGTITPQTQVRKGTGMEWVLAAKVRRIPFPPTPKTEKSITTSPRVQSADKPPPMPMLDHNAPPLCPACRRPLQSKAVICTAWGMTKGTLLIILP